jgi:hypothetical protein
MELYSADRRASEPLAGLYRRSPKKPNLPGSAATTPLNPCWCWTTNGQIQCDRNAFAGNPDSI